LTVIVTALQRNYPTELSNGTIQRNYPTELF
jgi:hypothetical protein